ncbi:MAG TPA: hypothetical protein VHZ03_30035 [Trebonia sp.]|nr:hypothetical protein [Trebonia sp.]
MTPSDTVGERRRLQEVAELPGHDLRVADDLPQDGLFQNGGVPVVA